MTCFDPRDMTEGWHKANTVERVMGNKFVDVTKYDFSALSPTEKARTFVLLDDHHAHLQRLVLFLSGWLHQSLGSSRRQLASQPRGLYLWQAADGSDRISCQRSPIHHGWPGCSRNLQNPLGKSDSEYYRSENTGSRLCDSEKQIPYWHKLDPKAITDQITGKPLYSNASFEAEHPGHDIQRDTHKYVNIAALDLPGRAP
eukprot:1737077-Rhodomonas_salina.2